MINENLKPRPPGSAAWAVNPLGAGMEPQVNVFGPWSMPLGRWGLQPSSRARIDLSPSCRLVEEVKELCDGLELENEDVYMATTFGDFVQLLVRKLRGEDAEGECVIDYVSPARPPDPRRPCPWVQSDTRGSGSRHPLASHAWPASGRWAGGKPSTGVAV